MLLFNPVTTQTRLCPTRERHDCGAVHSMDFLVLTHTPPPPPPHIKADVSPMGQHPLHLKMNPPLKMNLPFIEIWSLLSRNDS